MKNKRNGIRWIWGTVLFLCFIMIVFIIGSLNQIKVDSRIFTENIMELEVEIKSLNYFLSTGDKRALAVADLSVQTYSKSSFR